MLSPKTVDAKFLTTLAGAGFGASALEGDGDIFGTAIGLGVGAFAGSQVNLDLPKFDKFIQKNQTIKITNKPVSELSRLKEELLGKIKSQSTGFDFLSDDDNLKFSKEDPFNTLSNKNIKDVISNSTDSSELKTINNIIKNQNDFDKMSIKDLSKDVKVKDRELRAVAGSTPDQKKAMLRRYFEDKGYKGKDLVQKMNVFEPHLENNKGLVINQHTNKVTIGEASYRISSNFEGSNGISSHVGGDTFSAVRKLNPFANMYLDKEKSNWDGRAIAQALGINFADAAREDAISSQIEQYMRHGAKPEDLKALLGQSSEFSNSALDAYIDKAYQNAEYEGGFRAMGESQLEIERTRATDMSRMISNQTSVHQVFNLDRDSNMIKSKNPFRSFSAISKGQDGSPLDNFIRSLGQELGMDNLKENIKSDHAHLINTKGGTGGLNSLAPPERNQSTTGSRTNPVDINPNSKNRIVTAFDSLRKSGMVPREYSTSSAVSRLTVDETNFNLVSNFYNDKAILSLADGNALGKASVRADYTHKGFKKYDIFSSGGGSVAISGRLKENAIARTNLGIDLDAPEIDSKSYSRLMAIDDSLDKRITDLKNQNSSNISKADRKKNSRSIGILEKRRKELNTSIGFNENKTRQEIVSKLSGMDANSGNAKALEGILQSMNSSSKEGAAALSEYRKATNVTFSPGEVIGINPNGKEVRLSKEFKSYNLVKAYSDSKPNAESHLGLVFEGFSNTGADSIVKDFGTSAKVSVHNIGDVDFNRSFGIASFLNASGYIPFLDDKDNLMFDTKTSDADGNAIHKSFNDVIGDLDRFTAKAEQSGVAMITDTSVAGQKLSTNIHKTLKAGGDLSGIMVDDVLKQDLQGVVDKIPEQVAKLNLSPEDAQKATNARYWAVGQLATSLTEGKATTESLMGVAVLGLKNTRDLVDTFERAPKSKEGIYAENILRETLGSEIFEVDPVDFKATAENKFKADFKVLSEKFSKQNVGRSFVDKSLFSESTTNLYALGYLKEGESTHIGSSDISSFMRTGSGGVGKKMSHSAQMQLRMIGYTDLDFNTFGQQSAEDLYDLKFITQMSKELDSDVTINSFLDTKEPSYKKTFLNTIARLQPEMIDNYLITENVPQKIIDQDFLYYGIENNNKSGIKTIPIHKHSTSRIGTYTLDSGQVISKDLQNSVFNVISKDQQVSTLGPNLVEAYDSSSAKLESRIIENFLSKNNPQMKTSLALEAPNSTYSVVKHASSLEFDNAVHKFAERGESLIGMTEASAVQTLRRQGIDVDASTLHKFIGTKNDGRFEGMLMTELTDGTLKPSIVLENREPALSEHSIRHSFVKVLKSKDLGENDTFGVYHSSKDVHYTSLMFGDYDLDHTTVYDSQRKLSPEEYASRETHTANTARNRNELIKLNKILGIKNKEKPEFSLNSLIEEVNTQIKNKELNFQEKSPEYFEHIVEKQGNRMQSASKKGSMRKTTSPGVTQMLVNMSENIFQLTNVNGVAATVLDKEIMGTIGHGLVEDLLKMQHSDTGSFGKEGAIQVEKLLAARSSLAKNQTEDTVGVYKKTYRDSMKSLLKDNYADYEKHTEAMLEADIQYIKDPSKAPSNAMDVPKNIQNIHEGGIAKLGEIIEDIGTGRNSTQLNTLPLTSEDINVERSMKVSYNELLSNGKQNLLKNKFPLMMGAGGLALGALITQKDPNFQPSKKARADTGSMMLAPNVVSQEQSKQSDPMILQNLGRVATDYINPETSLQDINHSVKKAIRIQGSYQHLEQDINQSMKEAIFGNNISNVRIERDYD